MKIFRFWLIFLFFTTQVYAQPCGVPFSPSNTCQTAPYVCTLDGYCANNQGAVNSGTPNAFCGGVENNNWVKFVAGSTSFQIRISVNNCQTGQGLQAQFFFTEDCQDFEAVTNCLNPVANNQSGILIANNLIIGETYYFMMDGKNGDVCDYQYELLEGEILSPAGVLVDPISILCEDGTLDIISTAVSPNTNSTYLWTTADGNIISDPSASSITVDASGTYEVFIEDDQGCTATTMVEVVEEPTPVLDFDFISPLNCLNNLTQVLQVNVVGGNQGYDFLWTSVNGNILQGADTPSPEVNTPAEYEVLVTNQTTGCTVTGSVTVTVDIETPVAIASNGGELNCLVADITLDGIGSSFSGDFSSQWSTTNGNIVSGANTLTPLVDAAGTYELLVTNTNNGCTATASSIITLNEAEPTGADISLSQPCFGERYGSIIINDVSGGIEPYNYAFDGENFGLANERNLLEPATYTLTIRDETGCEWDTLFTIANQQELIVDLGPDETVLLGCEYDLKAYTNYPLDQIAEINWTPELVDCEFCDEARLLPLNSQMHTVQFIDINGCEGVDTVTYLVKKERNIYIPNAFSPNADGRNDHFMIYGGKDVLTVKTFKVFNRWGELLLEYNNFPPNDIAYAWDGKLNRQRVNSNVFIYYVEILFLDGWSQVYQGDVTLVR